jgi:hypothetical protein
MLLWPAGKACGQKYEIIGGIGIGQCRMQDLKNIQDFRLAELGLPGKITDDFPWTIHYSGELNMRFKRFSAGFEYFFLTSGSRISYSDYSGEIELDLITIAHGIGPTFMYPVCRTDKLWIGPRFQLPVMISRITEKNYIRLLDENETESNVMYSMSIGLFPSVEAKYIKSRLSFAVNIGYLFDSKGRIVEDNDWTIYLNNKEYTTTDWSGFHFDFRLGFTLFPL